MVNIGVIGLGPAWERRYRPALHRLEKRMRVRAVFDPVFSRSACVASELQAIAEGGLLALAKRPDVHAVLLLDAAWYGCEALRLVCGANKPVYIAADLGDDPSTLQALHWTAVNFGLTLMPEMGRRYTPASARLQELMATCLGRPQQITVTFRGETAGQGVDGESTRRELLAWFDWVRYVIRATPRQVRSLGEPETDAVRIDYAAPKSGGASPFAELRFANAEAEPESRDSAARQEIHCERGNAAIESPTVIRWESQGRSATETLTADRNETEVMLDHFCRRVVGGLIPVADLADISQGLELVNAARESRRSGRPVSLNGRSNRGPSS
ncbi:MAG: hypothetical protein ACE5KM_10900 [Planctomycetaceae bacterium]